MTERPLPSAEYLRVCLRYVPETGQLFWRERPREHFSSLRGFRTWNARFAGKEAFRAPQHSGHLNGTLDWKHYPAHRVIWKIVTGEEPAALIDHKDRDPTNNRWENLREATKSQNNINSTVKLGIYFDKSRGKWAAGIRLKRKHIHLGRYSTREEALEARAARVREIFGEFAPV